MSADNLEHIDGVHYPYCNAACEPGWHRLTNDEYPHAHERSVASECALCRREPA